MPNTLTVDLASLNKDQFQRIWNVIFGEPEIDYKHAHETDKAVFDAVLAKRDAEIRKLDAEVDLLKRDAEDAYKRGYSEGKDAGHEDVYEKLPISDVDGLHKAALAVCDDAQNRNETEGDDYVVDKKLVRALQAVACWSAHGTVEVLPAKPPPFEVWSSGHNIPTDSTWKRTFHIRRADPYCDEWMVGFGAEEQAREVVRLIESGDLDPDLVTPGSEFDSIMLRLRGISLVVFPQGPKHRTSSFISFKNTKPNRYSVCDDDEDAARYGEDRWSILDGHIQDQIVIDGFRSLEDAEKVCAQVNSGEILLPLDSHFEIIKITDAGIRVRDRSAHIDLFKQ